MSHTRPPTPGQHLDTPIMAHDRELLLKRLDHRDLQQTHVVVGDHPPEPRTVVVASDGGERRVPLFNVMTQEDHDFIARNRWRL